MFSLLWVDKNAGRSLCQFRWDCSLSSCRPGKTIYNSSELIFFVTGHLVFPGWRQQSFPQILHGETDKTRSGWNVSNNQVSGEVSTNAPSPSCIFPLQLLDWLHHVLCEGTQGARQPPDWVSLVSSLDGCPLCSGDWTQRFEADPQKGTGDECLKQNLLKYSYLGWCQYSNHCKCSLNQENYSTRTSRPRGRSYSKPVPNQWRYTIWTASKRGCRLFWDWRTICWLIFPCWQQNKYE